MIKIHEIKLDCSEKEKLNVVTDIRQGEVGSNRLEISVIHCGAEVTVDSDSLVVMFAVRPDGVKMCNICEVEGNKICYTLKGEDTNCAGVVEYQPVIYSQGDEERKVFVAPKFNCVVQESVGTEPYVLLNRKPADWEENHGRYFRIEGDNFVPVATADEWREGEIYLCKGIVETSANLPVLDYLIKKVEGMAGPYVTVQKLTVNENGEVQVIYTDSTSEILGELSGTAGKSAYDIAVENGFEGTEEQWLASLKGADGVSIRHGWNGTSLTVVSASGASSRELRGAKGEDGVSCTHSFDGTVLTVTSASGTSSSDLKGADGYTPVKGEDYFTEEDKTEIAGKVLEILPVWNGGSY